MNKLLLRSLTQALLVAACSLSLCSLNLKAHADANNDNGATWSSHSGNQKKRRRVRRQTNSARQPVATGTIPDVVSGETPKVSGVVTDSKNTVSPASDSSFKTSSSNGPSTQKPLQPIIGGVLNGKAKSLPIPRYPSIARSTRPSGTVVVEVLVNERGKVISARAVSGPPVFYATCVEAAYAARFWPTLLSGVPVKVTGIVTFSFVQ
jgi:protein TonB